MDRSAHGVIFALALVAAATLSGCQSKSGGDAVPLTLSRSMEEYFKQYKRSDGPRDFAIAIDGSYATYNYCRSGASACVYLSPSPQQRCESMSGKECRVFAVDGEIVWDGPITYESQTGGGESRASLAAQANKSAVDAIVRQIKDGGNGTFNAMAVNAIRADRRKSLDGYAKVGEHKAMAVSTRGAFSWVGARASVEDAALSALEECEFVGKQSCVLHAVNGRVLAADILSGTPVPVLRVTRGPFDPASVPFVAPSGADALKEYATAKSPKALAITLSGRWAIAAAKSSTAEATKEALEACKRKGANTAPYCTLFAVDDDMVFNPGN